MKINKDKLEVQMARKLMSYTDLSKKSGVNRDVITRATVKGNTKPSTVGKIANALGVDVEQIIDPVI